MILQSGFPLLLQQFKALLRKNFLLSWRNKRASFLQLFASFFFIFILFAFRKSEEARVASSTAYKRVSDSQPLVSPPILRCEDMFYVKKPCFDFVWSGNQSARVRRIARSIMANNPGRPIPSSKVKSFRTKAEADEWLNGDPMHCSGALHFVVKNSTVISYGIQVNSTSLAKRGHFEDHTFKVQIPLQIAAEREIARSLIEKPNFSWVVALKEYAHPAMDVPSMLETQAPAAFLATSMFGFVFQMSSLIAEKELKLKQAMTMMGLYRSAYWFSWLVWEGFLTLISSLFIVIFGLMFQFEFFLRTSFADLFFLFFLFQFNMMGLAFMFSSLMSKSTSSTLIGFSIFIIGILTQLVTILSFPYNYNIPKIYQFIWSFFAPNLLAEGLSLLMKVSKTDQGAYLVQRPPKCPLDNPDCEIITISDIYVWLLSTFFLWFVLAIYFDNIISDSFGVRKSAFYFLKPGYWTGKGGRKTGGKRKGESSFEKRIFYSFRLFTVLLIVVEIGGVCSCMSSMPSEEHIPPEDEDVLEEENLVKEQAVKGANDPTIAVQIRGLEKKFPGRTNISCFKCKKKSPYHALKGLWVNFYKDQIFCLLGHNGAGKTTAMNCLTGITPVTIGDALIYGQSIRSSLGVSKIQNLIGVCPQFDILWDELSGQEHLRLFASIKGLPPASLQTVIEESLDKVRLTEAAKVRTGSYSGGMKRRLSVAIAFIGDPKLVILDEPTTGMDPITRRHVWDVIEEAKKGRAIVLTTHFMEEADILSDRIGIMAKGRLRCIGTSIRLKSRFGAGFIAHVTFTNSDASDSSLDQKAVKNFFKHGLDVVPKEENKSFLTFVIPPNREALLPKFFAELQEREGELGIGDIQIGLTTLEEVFLNISRQAEQETAAEEGRFVTFTLRSGVSVQVPIGAQFVAIPGTECEENPRGTMVEVYWSQDDYGELCISGHSDETPVPPPSIGSMCTPSSLTNSPTSFFDRRSGPKSSDSQKSSDHTQN